MSLSALARASRIDSEVSRIARQASQLNSQLAAIVGETNAFAAFMHTDTNSEFTQADRDKYSNDFAQALGAIQATMAGFTKLAELEAEVITVEQFLAQYAGDVAEYSKRFDRG